MSAINKKESCFVGEGRGRNRARETRRHPGWIKKLLVEHDHISILCDYELQVAEAGDQQEIIYWAVFPFIKSKACWKHIKHWITSRRP